MSCIIDTISWNVLVVQGTEYIRVVVPVVKGPEGYLALTGEGEGLTSGSSQ